jgi:hypothetical protein
LRAQASASKHCTCSTWLVCILTNRDNHSSWLWGMQLWQERLSYYPANNLVFIVSSQWHVHP